MLEQARRNINSVEVKETYEMKDSLKEFILRETKFAIKYNDKFTDISGYILNEMDTNQISKNFLWTVLINGDHSHFKFHTYIKFKIGNINFDIFGTER